MKGFRASTSLPPFLVWGGFCQGVAPRGLSISFNVSFLVRPGQPVSSPRPTPDERPARAEAVKAGPQQIQLTALCTLTLPINRDTVIAWSSIT
jgi:hypothetical protein